MAQGALGDRVCAEPVVRSIRKIFPYSDLHVVGEKCFFSHIPDAKIHDFSERFDVPSGEVVMNSFHLQDRISVTCLHMVDFISLSAMGRCLSNSEKQIRILADEESLSRFSFIERDSLLVHCGLTSDNRTFPVEWWQEVVDLVSKRRKLVFVGKSLENGKGFLDVICPKDSLDLRNKTSLEDFVSLISMCDLLTNDSFPLHAAGAFDNNIFVVPTARHPDHLLPFRNGSQSYKTTCFFKRLMSDDFVPWGTVFHDAVPEGMSIMDYLPSPKDVAEGTQ